MTDLFEALLPTVSVRADDRTVASLRGDLETELGLATTQSCAETGCGETPIG